MTEQLEDWNIDDEYKKKVLDHPCMKCDVPIYQKFPHPIFRCDKDGHDAIMIIDLLQVLENLHDKCPLKEGG